MNILIKLFFIFSISFAAGLVEAKSHTARDEAIIQKLIKREHRPTVEEVYQAFRGKIPQASRDQQNNKTQTGWGNSIRNSLPIVIAKLEYYYPGAIWAALGRDATPIADLLEAFYLNHGQTGRAVRISASTGTFLSSPTLFIRMLKQLGMDLKKRNSRPFIIFDRTSYGDDSQSTKLIQMIYNHYLGKRISQNKLQVFLKKAAIVTSAHSSTASRIDFFKSVFQVSKGQQYPWEILGVGELNNFTDQVHQEWHGTFGELITYKNGRISGIVDTYINVEKRRAALEMMFEAYHEVRKNSFYQDVRREAKKLGYDFDQRLSAHGNDKAGSVAVVDRTDEELVEEEIESFFADLATDGDYENEFAQMLKEKLTEEYLEKKQIDLKKLQSDLASVKTSLKAASQKSALFVSKHSDFSNFSFLMLVYFKTLQPLHDSKEKTYLSENANEISKVFEDYFIESVSYYGLAYIRTLDYAVEQNLISIRDYRRMVLFVLAKVEESRDLQFYNEVDVALHKKSLLYQVLTERSEVFLTSKRYNQKGKEAYIRLVNYGYLPKPKTCNEALAKAG